MMLVSFLNLAPPRFIHTPARLSKVPANSVASVRCRAFGFPPPTIVWSRGFARYRKAVPRLLRMAPLL